MAALSVPDTYEEAMKSEGSSEWIKAIGRELDAHQENVTWSLVEKKPGVKIIESKWVFRLMKDAGENVYKYKVRLCARGFMQRKGVDFMETFAPVVRYDSLLLAVAVEKDLELA